MSLYGSANHFDDDRTYDAYTGKALFKAQLSNFDAAAGDGSYQRRRTLSCKPCYPWPARRVIKVGRELWVIGEPVIDNWKGKPIRKTANARLVTDAYQVLTPGQAALRAPVTPAQPLPNAPTPPLGQSLEVYAFTEYFKDTVDPTTDANYDAFYRVTVGSMEDIIHGGFLKSEERLLFVRGLLRDTQGFWVASCDEISLDKSNDCDHESTFPDNLVTVTLAGRWDPVEEVELPGMTVTGVLMDRSKLYERRSRKDELDHAGDKTLILPTAIPASAPGVTPAVAAKPIKLEASKSVKIGSGQWRIMGYVPYQDAWMVHIRRA